MARSRGSPGTESIRTYRGAAQISELPRTTHCVRRPSADRRLPAKSGPYQRPLAFQIAVLAARCDVGLSPLPRRVAINSKFIDDLTR
jgi:hypothetical protein